MSHKKSRGRHAKNNADAPHVQWPQYQVAFDENGKLIIRQEQEDAEQNIVSPLLPPEDIASIRQLELSPSENRELPDKNAVKPPRPHQDMHPFSQQKLSPSEHRKEPMENALKPPRPH